MKRQTLLNGSAVAQWTPRVTGAQSNPELVLGVGTEALHNVAAITLEGDCDQCVRHVPCHLV